MFTEKTENKSNPSIWKVLLLVMLQDLQTNTKTLDTSDDTIHSKKFTFVKRFRIRSTTYYKITATDQFTSQIYIQIYSRKSITEDNKTVKFTQLLPFKSYTSQTSNQINIKYRQIN